MNSFSQDFEHYCGKLKLSTSIGEMSILFSFLYSLILACIREFNVDVDHVMSNILFVA